MNDEFLPSPNGEAVEETGSALQDANEKPRATTDAERHNRRHASARSAPNKSMLLVVRLPQLLSVMNWFTDVAITCVQPRPAGVICIAEFHSRSPPE